ncbi:type VII secretion-associated protein [Candidatus Mycobacterium wuenschmannii]|uniref:Type VII secretion-associated protein n=1 Tax=Candidatus Mycobacterium wuenschmannii TaxID=3027808 RepID=A0ABY8VZL6_9MYCO|nr:type VII secretion-associated protein [Candidatus Mycobacterium wuenschmannii]WIM87637.1 type VII secretion-associated protein [Candidatus Mycobacterium wuenschmannii]
MRSHVIEVGPSEIRRFCCGGVNLVDSESARTALESIDDQIALVESRPASVASLWEDIFRSIDCGAPEGKLVVHPSWWSSARLAVIRGATDALAGPVELRPRTFVLGGASSSTVIVEIADDFVVVTGESVTAERRGTDTGGVAAAIRTMTGEIGSTVVIDVPSTVRDAAKLATEIAEQLPGDVVLVDDIRFRKLVRELPAKASSPVPQEPARRMSFRSALSSVAVVAGLVTGVGAMHLGSDSAAGQDFPTTDVVEGRVTLKVPAQWTTQRVVTGPGSARVQVTSPTDAEVALHVTQSRVALQGLEATAEFLKSAIDAADAGVFVDFNPGDHIAGRPVVSYREVRPGHVIRWIVWVERAIRISIGCQSRREDDDPVRRECDLAVGSAHVLE